MFTKFLSECRSESRLQYSSAKTTSHLLSRCEVDLLAKRQFFIFSVVKFKRKGNTAIRRQPVGLHVWKQLFFFLWEIGRKGTRVHWYRLKVPTFPLCLVTKTTLMHTRNLTTISRSSILVTSHQIGLCCLSSYYSLFFVFTLTPVFIFEILQVFM